MPTPRTSSERVKVRLEDQERQRAREQDQTVSLLDEYWGIPDPQYPSCFSKQKLYTMARREEDRDPFLASTSGVSTLSDVSEKKGSRQLMVLGKFYGVFNSRRPSLLFWSTLTLLLTSMTMTKMSKELETKTRALREESSANTISLVRLLGDLKEKEEQLKNSRDENQKITEILKDSKRNNELLSKELIKKKSSIKQLSRECQALEKQLSGAQDNIKSKEEKYQRQAEINETKNLAAMLLLALLISKITKLNSSNVDLRKQLGEEKSTLKEAKDKFEQAEKVKQVLKTEKEDLISSHEASLLHIASLLYITDTLISKKELIAEIEEKIQNLKWKVISKEAWIATNAGAGLRDKKSSNQQQREEKSQGWRKRKNHITMSSETHPSIEQTRSENSGPTLETAESKEKVQLKGTELRQLRKLECNKEEMSKIVVDPLKIKEDKAGPTVDIGDPLNEKLELISRFRNFFLPPAQERNQSLKEELQRLDLEEEKGRQAEIQMEIEERRRRETHRAKKEEEEGRHEAAKITEIQKKKEKEDNELAKRKEEAHRVQEEEEKKAQEARIANLRKELEIQKEKQARLEEESRRLETIEEERRKKEKQKEETHRLQKEEKEKRRKEASKAQKEKEKREKAERPQIQQMKAKNDLQTQKTEVDSYELTIDGHKVSITKDQWTKILIIKLLMCGIPLLAKFPKSHMRLFALAAKNISLSSHHHR